MINKVNSIGNYYIPKNFNQRKTNPIKNEVKQVSFEGASLTTINKLYSPKKLIMPMLLGAMTFLPMQKMKADEIEKNKIVNVSEKTLNSNISQVLKELSIQNADMKMIFTNDTEKAIIQSDEEVKGIAESRFLEISSAVQGDKKRKLGIKLATIHGTLFAMKFITIPKISLSRVPEVSLVQKPEAIVVLPYGDIEILQPPKPDEITKKAKKIFPENDGKLPVIRIILPESKETQNPKMKVLTYEIDSTKYIGIPNEKGEFEGIMMRSFEIPIEHK